MVWLKKAKEMKSKQKNSILDTYLDISKTIRETGVTGAILGEKSSVE